jgi:hypothetical protein
MPKPKKPSDIVPAQKKGQKLDTSRTIEFSTRQEAVEAYARARERLLDVNSWEGLAGALSAKFQLMDAQGRAKAGPPEPGDHFSIDLPAPGSPAGEGPDWVRLEKVENLSEPASDLEGVAMRVRPCDNPHNAKDEVAHFYTDDATSSFIVERRGNKVTGHIHGRNEIPNTEQTDSLLDKARNALVALPAMVGLAKTQWSSLVDGWLEGEDKG